MNQTEHIFDEDFIAALESDCPSEWAIDSDEIGNPVYCETAIVDQLQLDAA